MSSRPRLRLCRASKTAFICSWGTSVMAISPNQLQSTLPVPLPLGRQLQAGFRLGSRLTSPEVGAHGMGGIVEESHGSLGYVHGELPPLEIVTALPRGVGGA